MLKTKIPNQDIILRTNIFTEDFSSDRDFYNQKLLNFSTNGVINNVIDSEVYEYKPESTDELNFNIFFLRYVRNVEYNELKNYVEFEFQNYYNALKLKFGLIDESGNEIPKAFNNIYETRQSNGLRETQVLADKSVTKIQELIQKPYVVRDIAGEGLLKKPTRSGIPVFYNSFTIPYWESKDKWVNDDLLYANKSYFYNSFLLMEFYDSPLSVSQNRVQSIPVFINKRNNITEKNVSKSFNYERPCFKLKNGTEGYSFFFLNTYITNEFYVRYSFWDALNAVKIPLLPSSNIDENKKWLQDSDNFNQNARYLKYVLDFETKTYKIFEYDESTNDFSVERTNFDLYQLEFDSYYSNMVVKNQQPIDSTTQITTSQVSNPFTFTIKNLYTNNYLGDSVKQYDKFTEQEIGNLKTYLNSTSSFIHNFNEYVGNLNVDIFGLLPKKEYTIPVINRKITGYQILLKSFVFKNNDTVTWNIRGFNFSDVSILVNGVNITQTYYNQFQSEWNQNPSYRIAEAITLLSGNSGSLDFLYDTVKFTTEIFQTYLTDSGVFRRLLELIEDDRFNEYLLSKDVNGINTTGYNYSNSRSRVISEYLDFCFNVLKVKYNPSHTKTTNYAGLAYNPTTNTLDYTKSEIHYYIDKLVENFNKLKTTDNKKFIEIKDKAITFLTKYHNEFSDRNISLKLAEYISSILSPKDNEELVNKYLLILSKKGIDSGDKDKIEKDINLNSLSTLLDKPVVEVGYEARDYTFDVFAIQNGDKIVIPNESNEVNVYFSIGEKIKFIAANTPEIVINGKLRISLVNNSGDIKNIVIPLKSSIKSKYEPTGNLRRNIPTYNVSKPEPGSTINQLTIIE